MAFIPTEYERIITIDFGTISTGATYANIDSLLNGELTRMGFEANAITVKKWPGQQSIEYRTPSVSIYNRQLHLLHWGGPAQKYIEDGNLSPYRLVKEKLKLEFPVSVPQEGIDYKINNVKKMKYDNMGAIIDYFTEIFNYTVDQMRSNGKIRFVITVPAQWAGAERSVMRSISKKAKMIDDQDHENRLLIINESLAAALYCDLEMTDSQDMKLGDKYIVCDAGGYTVKLATFECVERSENDPVGTFGHCQLTNSSSAKCGSTFIDMKMYKLLTRFFYNGEPPKNKEEKDERDGLFAPIMKKFINEIKPVFGRRSSEFKFPKCNHYRVLETYANDTSKISIDEDNSNDDNCIICKLGDFKHLHRERFGDSFTIRLEDAIIVPKLKLYLPDGVKYTKSGGVCTLVVPYSIIRTEVFNSVIRSTLNLIENQIKKVNGSVKRIYIVGGFASSPLLQKMIFRRFYVKGNLFPHTKFRIGSLVDSGPLAVMKGAIKYGTDDVKEVPQSDIVKNEFGYTTTDKYDTLICLDIGYESTSCSYKDLISTSGEIVDITNWPDNEKNILIPTAKETTNDKTYWGASVNDPFNRGHKKLITPSKLMALVKADFRKYLCQYLQLVLNHVYETISGPNSLLSNRGRYRYVITTENCYPFFTDKSEMRKIVEKAGITSAEDSAHRLLLINRDHASAMYFEKKHFLESLACTHHFLQINMYHDTCYLSLFESIKIKGRGNHSDAGYCRNVRRLKSVTFDFDFIDRTVLNLNKYVTENVCIECKDGHDPYSFYYSDLKKGFLNFLKTSLDFSKSGEIQHIQITDSKCCTALIKVYDLLEYILFPALEDLASEIERFARQVDIMLPKFKLDKIFLLGALIETNKPAYSFLELFLMKKISALVNVDVNHIIPSDCDGKEALLGATHYGIRPTDFTERVSKHSYAVNIRAYAIKQFSAGDKDDIENERKKDGNDKKHDVYNLESDLSAADFEQQVELFHHTKDSQLNPDHLIVFTHRGDKVLEDKISKTFFAKRDCLVYATIYRSDLDDLPQDESKLVSSSFRKIHRFEIYLKVDEDDPTAMTDNSRLSFDISYTANNYEALFEAQICSILGRKIPDFYIRDEFLVANIYDDSQHVEIGDLQIEQTLEN